MVANHRLLKEIAEKTGAFTVGVKELDKLGTWLNANEKLKPIYRSEVEFIELSRLGTLGFILLLLLCLEWFLLKYFAG